MNPTQPATPAEAPRGGQMWPWLVAGLLLSSFVFQVTVLVVAGSDPSVAVERDYYQKSLAWDDTMRQERRNHELGWEVAVALEPGPQGQRRVVARVVDLAGAPVEGARVSLSTFHNARAAQVLQADLEATGEPGAYAGDLPMRRPGLWELRLAVERGEERFTRVLRQDLRG